MDWVKGPVSRSLTTLGVVFCTLGGLAWGQSSESNQAAGLAELIRQAQQARDAFQKTVEAQQESLQQATDSASPAETLTTKPSSSAPPAKAPQAISDVKMSLDGTFDLHIQDADVRLVLRQLSLQSRKNIVTSAQVTGTVTADLYGVTFQEAMQAVVDAAGMVYLLKDDVIYVLTPAELEQRKEEEPIETRVFHLRYLTATDAKDLVKDMLSEKGKITNTPAEHTGIEYLEPSTGSKRLSNIAEDMLVVQDYRNVVEEIAQVIAQVDIRPQQVLIEATILSAELNEDNALGVDLQVLSGLSFNTFGVTSDLTSLNSSAASVKNFDHSQSRLNTTFSQNMPTDLGPPATFGFISNQVGAFIQALDSIRDVTVLANPKLLVVNKQRGEVIIGREDGYLTTVVTDTSAIQQVEFLKTGTLLTVRPFVGKDEYIRMEIQPEDSSGSVAPVEEGGPALPTKRTTQITSNVIVRDGRTIVIGGLFRDEIQTTRRQVPIVGDIPWLGSAFRSTVDVTRRHEVIILITPHVVRDVSQEAVGERMRMKAERYRIGARAGLRWWGRNRLSANYLRRANQAWSAGDANKAQWWLDLCLTLQPDMMEAMLLKEKITDQATWADPPQLSSCRYLVTRMLMQELGKDVDRVTPPSRPLHAEQIDPAVRKALGIYPQPSSKSPRPTGPLVPRIVPDSPVPGQVEMVPAPTTKPATTETKTPPPGEESIFSMKLRELWPWK